MVKEDHVPSTEQKPPTDTNPGSHSKHQFERLLSIRMGGGVERCHTIRHQGSYSNAAHSWGVAVIMFVLWPQDFPRLAPYCIFHDVPEAWVGDVPAPTKKFDGSVKLSCDRMESLVFDELELPYHMLEEDVAKLRACDSLELYFWAAEQVHGGNKHAECVLRELEGFFARDPLLPEAFDLYRQIKDGSVGWDLGKMYRKLFKGT